LFLGGSLLPSMEAFCSRRHLGLDPLRDYTSHCPLYTVLRFIQFFFPKLVCLLPAVLGSLVVVRGLVPEGPPEVDSSFTPSEYLFRLLPQAATGEEEQQKHTKRTYATVAHSNNRWSSGASKTGKLFPSRVQSSRILIQRGLHYHVHSLFHGDLSEET
jgi:hypothetical protein